MSISGMSKIRARYKKTRSVSRKKGSGPKRGTTKLEDKFIVKAALKNRRSSIVKLTRELTETSNITVSRSTITRRLKEKGFARRTACYRPKLTDGQKARRLAFAQQYVNRTVRFWKTVMVSDEKIFAGDNDSIRVLVTRKRSERHLPECCAPRKKWGPRVHVWGLIAARRTVALRVIHGNLNAAKYTNEVIPDIRDLLRLGGPGRRRVATFQQDGAPSHTAHHTRNFLAAQHVRVLPWPANSPDLNPIEHIWSWMARWIQVQGQPTNGAQLAQRVREAWDAVPSTVLQSLFSSMRRRLQEVIANAGGPTTY